MGAAIVPDVIVIRHYGDVRCPPSVFPDKPDDRVVAAMGGPGEDASDPGQALIAAARKSDVAVKNDDTLYGRVPLAPPGYQKSQLVSCAFKPLIQDGFQFGDPVDDIITVDKEDLLRGH